MRQSRDSGPLALARKGRAKPWVAACSALTLIVITCLSGAAGASPGDVLWSTQWDLAGKNDQINALGVSDNQVLVAGRVTNASGNTDWLVRAYDAGTGAVKWTDQWDLAGKDDYANALAMSGNQVFVAGYGKDTFGHDLWVVRAYDAGTGAAKWTNTLYPALSGVDAHALAVSGNQVLVAGQCTNASGNTDWLVNAYDGGTGAVLWTDQWDLAGKNDAARNLAVSGNQVFVAGQGLNISGNYDWLVRAYDLTPVASEKIGVDQVLTGKLNKKGTKFTPTSTFKRGNKVYVFAHLKNYNTGVDLAGAAVDISITGLGFTGGLTVYTDSTGWTGIYWTTTKKTLKGAYTATVTKVVPPGPTESWDGVQKSTPFSIN